jgi:hypothetical protein
MAVSKYTANHMDVAGEIKVNAKLHTWISSVN